MAEIDRRWIFLAMGLAVVIPFVLNWRLPSGSPNPRTQATFEMVEKAKPGDVLVIAFDYGPSVMPELHPMALALTRHGLGNDLRVVAMTMGVQGSLMADDILAQVAEEMPEKQDGVDYVNLGYKPGGEIVVLGMGDDITNIYPKDSQGRRSSDLKVLEGVRNFDDIYLVVDLASSSTPDTWIMYAHERFGQELAAGVTAVMATDYYPYLDTGQLVGMLNGLKGAAEYEQLIGHADAAVLGMTAQSVAQLAMILFVIVGNIGYFATRRRSQV